MFVLVCQHPGRSHKAAEGRHYSERETFDALVEAKKKELLLAAPGSSSSSLSANPSSDVAAPPVPSIIRGGPYKPKKPVAPRRSQPAPKPSPVKIPTKRPRPNDGSRRSTRLAARSASPDSNHSSPVFGNDESRNISLPVLPSLAFALPPAILSLSDVSSLAPVAPLSSAPTVAAEGWKVEVQEGA